jgi:hypothetical protein
MQWKAIGKLTIALALGISPLASAGGAKPADGYALDANSKTALVVVKTDWWQPAPSMQSAFKLTLSVYDPVEEKLRGKPFGGSVLFEAKQKKFVDGYLIAEIKPGRWVFQSYAQQDKWALCFNAASLQFEVKPGEVLYLGAFDALNHRRQLTEQAFRSGKTSLGGYSFADFFDLAEGPRVGPIDEGQLAAVRGMLGRTAPRVTAPVRAAEYSPARFGTGSTLFAQRRCGGYFTTGAKGKDQD